VPTGDPTLWEVDPFGAVIRDGRLHGRGSSDAKGPVAAAIEAAAVLRRAGIEPSGTLELELVADEEAMGFKGAGYLVAEGIVSPDIAIVGEPTGLKVVRAQRGACWMKVTTRGLAAHGSAPERGVSAIRHMAEIVARLEETLPDITHPIVGGPSINVGTIHGGEKVNMVPAACIIEVDRRSVPGESEATILESVEAAIEAARAKFPDIDATVEFPFYARPFEVPEGARVVTEVAKAVTEATGVDAQLAGFRGASDARFLAEAGADVVVCGPGEIALAHTARESIDLEELERAAVAYALAFARLLAP
jgi:acetylornithine deacetylase/succinyl-diaminopimelate desuccinylase family protein